MVEDTERNQGSYRCPVCGHHDMADVPVEQEAILIRCSHCGTELELTPRDAESFSVQVAERRASSG